MRHSLAIALSAAALLLVPSLRAQDEPAKKVPAKKAAPNVTISRVQGSGNTVIVTGDGPGSVKVITQTQGPGNRVIVTHNGKVVVPEKLRFQGKDNKFWSHKQFHAELKMMLFWSPQAQFWFRYDAKTDAYVPAVEVVEHEARRIEQEALRAAREIERILEDLDR